MNFMSRKNGRPHVIDCELHDLEPSALYCSHNLPRAPVVIVVANDEHCMYHGRNPEKETQEEIYNCLNGFSAQEDGERRKKYGQYIEHDYSRL